MAHFSAMQRAERSLAGQRHRMLFPPFFFHHKRWVASTPPPLYGGNAYRVCQLALSCRQGLIIGLSTFCQKRRLELHLPQSFFQR